LPFTTQHGCQRKWICRSRDAVKIVEGAHERANARIDRGLKRRKVNLAQRLFRHVRCVVVATPFRGSISHPVFCAGQNLSWGAVIMALKTEYTRPREGYAQKRILSCAFGNATPARIAGDIDHGRKRPTESRRIGFLRRDASRTLRQRG